MEAACSAIQLPGNAMPRFLSRRVNSSDILFSVLLLIFTAIRGQNSDVIPPVIVSGPPLHMIYYREDTVSLPCTCNGSLPMTYKWLRNGYELNPNSKVSIDSDGHLHMHQPEEGYYQCTAQNMAGVAVSNVTHLQKARFDGPYGRPQIQMITRKTLQSLVLHCNHVRRSIPSASITWKFSNNTNVPLDDRVTVTPNGSLVFTYLQNTDSTLNGSYYKCFAFNPIALRSFGGSYYSLTVFPVSTTSELEKAAELLYSSSSVVYVLEGHAFNLSCIFSGLYTGTTSVKSTPTEWLLLNGTTVVTRQLHFASAKPSDQGNYTCRDALKRQTENIIQVIVDAFPKVKQSIQKQVVLRGSTVRFSCQGTGRPNPAVSWIINGTQSNGSSYRGENLVLHDVQSSASIACNVSNKYGYQLSSAYFLVVDAIMTTSSQDIKDDTSSSSISLNGTTTTKISTTTSRKNDVSDSKRRPPVSGGVNVTGTSTSSSISDKSGVDMPMDSDPVGFNKLWILVGAVLAVLAVVIIILAIYCQYRKRKRSYSIKPKPEKDIEMELYRDRETNVDSDDSGYDDVSRKPGARLKHTKRLSDTPEEVNSLRDGKENSYL